MTAQVWEPPEAAAGRYEPPVTADDGSFPMSESVAGGAVQARRWLARSHAQPVAGARSDRLESNGRERQVVVIGGSAGAHVALRAICAALPPDFPAPILVVIHRATRQPSHLAHMLNRAGPLIAVEAAGAQCLLPGSIYVAPPDHHLLLRADRCAELSEGPLEGGFRPSIDALFRSAAIAFGAGTTAVLLSGCLRDGVAGVDDVLRAGGRVIVQDPEDARFGSLPTAALEAHATQRILRAANIASELCGPAAP